MPRDTTGASLGASRAQYEAGVADAAASDTVLHDAMQIFADFVQRLGPNAQGKQAA
jgi:hypothetical protein